jgi:Tol biopolymer transport system component
MTPFGVERRGFELWPVPSEDGDRIAVVMANEKNNYEIWTADRDRPRFVRTLSVPGADLTGPSWSPDGKWLTYSRSAQDSDDGVYVVSADGTGPPRLVFSSQGAALNAAATSWARDSSGVFVTKSIGRAPGQLFFVPLPSGGTPAAPRALRATSNEDWNAQLSPNGRVIAFQSNESGRSEVYVATYVADGLMGRPLMVSSGGGSGIGWAGDGRRLFFGSSPHNLMSVTVEAGAALRVSTPVIVHDLEKLRANGWGIEPDGRLLIIQRSEAEDDITHFSVVFNWFDELRARLNKR